MNTIVWLAVGYLVGSIPFAFLMARRVRGVDLRRLGSGNVGAANVMRTAGPRAAVAVAALDAAKGAAAVFVAQRAGGGGAAAVAGVGAVLGHVWPMWLSFRGGKGVATAFGVFVVLAPEVTLLCLLGFVGTVAVTRYVSLGSLVSTVALPPLIYLTGGPAFVVAASAMVAALIVERHRPNMARLRAGTERRLGQPAACDK